MLATSSEYAGKNVSEVFGHLAGHEYDWLAFSPHPESATSLAEEINPDVVFLATPDSAALKYATEFIDKNIKVVDISGAFRLDDAEKFKKYYNLDHDNMQLQEKAVYGLTEMNREQIKNAKLVSNPGCYPSSVLAPLWAMRDILTATSDLIIADSKSGTSGAGGRKEKDSLGFSTVYENFRSYKFEGHQHEPEIEQELNKITAGKQVRFTPHLLPLFRGILSTVYLQVKEQLTVEEITQTVKKNIEDEPFLRFYENPNDIRLSHVQNTNFVDFSFYYDRDKGVIVVISAIDNLMKGAAGQATQNMNLMLGYEETEGLI